LQIGLIGGIGPAAQDHYCRHLITLFAKAHMPLDMTIVHADTPTLLTNLAADKRIEQAEIFARLSQRLARAGADFVAITSIAGHFCRREFADRSALPVIDMVDAVAQYVADHSFNRIGILGTRTVMESRFYGGLPGVTVVPPTAAEMDAVHTAYVEMAAAGVVSDAQRETFYGAACHLMEEHSTQAIMLGGTDLALVFNQTSSPFPLVDGVAIHAQAIAKTVLG
jgi:aspartate racemase